jgi:hypothetical protein
MKTFDDVYEETGDIERIKLGSPKILTNVTNVSGREGSSGEIILYYKEALPGTISTGENVALSTTEKVATVQINAEGAYIVIGSGKHDGFLTIKNANDEDVVRLNGGNATVYIGEGQSAGKLALQSKYGETAMNFDGETGKLILGANLVPGTLILNHIGSFGTSNGSKGTISLSGDSGNITLGGNSRNGSISVRNSDDIETIWIDGDAGDITFRNADFAEEFDICPDALPKVEPGMVMVLGAEGGLAPCDRAYDSRVAGIVCGAGGYKPGIVMDNAGKANRLPIAVMGKIFCCVDASKKPVRTGDLLTTGRSYGHAMRAESGYRSFGAIIGKALASLRSGRGLVPVLVSLQ